MDSSYSHIKVGGSGNTHRFERGSGFEGYRYVRCTGCDHGNSGHVPLLARVANRHPRFRVNRRQLAQHLHLLVAQTRCNSQLGRAFENLAQVCARLPRTVDHFRNSGARFAVAIPANLTHDPTRGSDRLPLCNPPRSSATNLKPAFLQARRSSPLSGSVTTRSNISTGISSRTTPSCQRARAGQMSFSLRNSSTVSICASRSGVTSVPTGTLLAKHGAAGFSAFERFQWCARARTSDLWNPASTSGAMTPRSIAACKPGR